jgi:hypothetical protein
MKKRRASILLLVALLMSCATANLNASKTLLNFLEDGMTTREEVILKLGQPSHAYEAERILTYRIGNNDSGYFLLDPLKRADWVGTSHSLVLVFDENNVLRKHSLVSVR